MISITLLSIGLGMIITRRLLKPDHRWSFVIDDHAIIVWTSMILLYLTHALPTILQNVLFYLGVGSVIATMLNIFFDTTDDHENQQYTKLIAYPSLFLILIGIISSMFNK